MAGNHILPFSSISEYFKDNIKQLKRGEIAYKDGHVLKFQADLDLNIIVGEIKPSMKNNKYKVKMMLNDSSIVEAECTCPRGQVVCHHIAALALYTHYNLSSTDKSCSWNVRKSNTCDEVKTISQIYGGFDSPSTIISDEDFSTFKHTLDNLSTPVGFSWLLRPEPEHIESNESLKCQLSSIESVVNKDVCKQLVKTGNFEAVRSYINDSCFITDDIVLKISEITTGQNKTELWHYYRKNRLTASHFGNILSACQKNKFSKSFFKSLKNDTNLSGIHAIQWGLTNEKSGIRVLEKEQNVNVVPTGLWLANNGFLGASPDGLINSDYIVEIKCPWKFRNKALDIELKNDHSYIIYIQNDTVYINKKHFYWHQIQGQLYLTYCKLCYLVIWTPNQTIITEVEKDPDWFINLKVLEQFFIKKFIPFLIEN